MPEIGSEWRLAGTGPTVVVMGIDPKLGVEIKESATGDNQRWVSPRAFGSTFKPLNQQTS